MPTSLIPSWATNEPHTFLWLEQATNAGVNLGSMAYGIHLVVFFTCSYCLFRAKGFSWFFQTYITILLILATVDIACNIRFNELTWIDERNYPGGPLAFTLEQQSLPIVIVGNAITDLVSLLVDALLIYRCYIVWGGNWYIIILPCLGLATSTTLSILMTIDAAQPGSSLFTATRFGLPHCALTMALHLVVTAIIATRLLLARKSIRQAMGPNSGRTYTGIIAMLVESAFPYAVIGIILIGFYAGRNPAGLLIFPVLPQVQCIVSDLIILRVNHGHAWRKNTLTNVTAVSAIEFGTSPASSGRDVMQETRSFKIQEFQPFAVSNHSLSNSSMA